MDFEPVPGFLRMWLLHLFWEGTFLCLPRADDGYFV